jgi:hypothetical protein
MKNFLPKATLLCCVLMSAPALNVAAQSLTDKLSEDESFYQNYGKETYAKLKIEKDVSGRYDMFGEHITDGVFLYDLHNESAVLSNPREHPDDSTRSSTSNEYQKRDFFEKFSNLVITQDAIGGSKSSFLIGDQITTKFSPLTFNKTNFKGIRWDIWTSKLQFSALLSRTRPGFLSKAGYDGKALVEYPLTEQTFPGTSISSGDDKGFSGNGIDFSSKSPYGDYDWLWAVHAQRNIANKVDVGLSYINHHMSDVKKGEQWLRGDVPNGWMPKEVHFEFYDMTPLNLNDAGVYVYDVTMFVNGKEVVAQNEQGGAFRRVFVGTPDSVLAPRELGTAPPQNGNIPLIVAFKTDPTVWKFKNDGTTLTSNSRIKTLTFKYSVAGNYLVFVSTSKQIPLGLMGMTDPNTNVVKYEYAEKTVEDIFVGKYQQPLKINAPLAGADFGTRSFYSTTYFGEYIRQSPKVLNMPVKQFNDACRKDQVNANLLSDQARARKDYNFYTYDYQYGINISSVTYGLDFKGELGGVKFSGEVAVNQREDKLPTVKGDRASTTRLSGSFKGEKAIGKKSGVNGELYYISPDWETNRDNLHVSRYFKETSYKGPGYDYLAYPRPLGNDWNNIDDNDDNDAFVESDRRHYPADRSNDEQGLFYGDGTMGLGETKKLVLPTDMTMTYDDPDGVIQSKDDRNRNGIRDYNEDFLLFSADPPVFELGADLNNNGIPDYEDDDILPDFGHSVGYTVTDAGIKTQGIQGVSLNYRLTPNERWTVDIGGVAEGILDHDLNGVADIFDASKSDAGRSLFEGKSFVLYNTMKFELLRRSRGILLQFGNEIRAIRDAIRNDAIQSLGMDLNGTYLVSYYYYLDQLNFRRAILDNLVADLTYNNIPNFEYVIRLKLGGQQRLGIAGEEFQTTYSFYDRVRERTVYSSSPPEPYDSRTIGSAYLVNRASYKIGFKNEFEDWRRVFNGFNRLEIIPQYKLGVFTSKEIRGPTENDPRNVAEDFRLDPNGDGLVDTVGGTATPDNASKADSLRIVNSQYRANNIVQILSVPIIRANFKIAENTQLQFGVQWARLIDHVTPEDNCVGTTILGQIVSKANYKGYNVTFFLGGRWRNYNYDVNTYDPVQLTGSRFDMKNFEFFAQIYSGN